MNIIFESQLYPSELEKEYVANSKVTLDFAAHNFSKAIYDGLRMNRQHLYLVNVPNLGSYPILYKKPRVKGCQLLDGVSIGYCNITYIKRYDIIRKLKKAIKEHLKRTQNGDTTVLLLYNFRSLNIINKIKNEYPSIRVCLIVTDLPEYMVRPNNAFHVLGKWVLNADKECVNINVSNIDGFVFLAPRMSEKLNVGNKPWIQMEGIYEAGSRIEKVSKEPGNVILYTGNLSKRYGIINLLDAFSGIQGDDYQLWLRGSGDCLEIVRERMKVDKRISLLPSLTRQELLKLQKKATILINPVPPSEEFTNYFFPSKTLEYLASGTPVLMYHLSCIPEEYDDYIFYIDEESAEGIKKKLLEVCNMSQFELNEIGEKASRFIMEKKTPQAQIRKVLDYLEDL